uniref:Uncharacterized protein n=1 Tax=Populus trichocarpa TaxID=3694 RepID=A0A3N7H6A0_POPTR
MTVLLNSLGRTLENIESNIPPKGIEEIGQVLVFLGESCDDSIRTKKHNIFRLVNETIHDRDIITRRAYRRRATYGLQTPVHELCPRLGPIDTSSGFRLKQELDASLYLGLQMDLIGFHEHLVE